jgi:hypothetical protein
MSISKVGTYAFYNHPNLERAVVSAPTIEANAFQNATKLEVADLTSEAAVSIAENAFNGCSAMKHLVVRSLTRSSLAATSALTGSPIALGEGGIYVPSSLLDSYKGGTNWSTYVNNIYPLGEYPRANFDSIDAAWSTILTDPDYATAYAVKDTKTLELTDGTKIKMDLAALDTDVKSDDSGTAKMTWICHGIPTTHRMNATAVTTDGWAGSEMRSWLISDILSKIPTEIKSHIVSVKKSYRSKSPNDETLWSDDEIWIPSYKEVGFTNASYVESDGVTYPTLFPSGTGTAAKNARIKHNTSGSASLWWLRSALSATYFRCVRNLGDEGSVSANDTLGVVFGFCTD